MSENLCEGGALIFTEQGPIGFKSGPADRRLSVIFMLLVLYNNNNHIKTLPKYVDAIGQNASPRRRCDVEIDLSAAAVSRRKPPIGSTSRR